MAGQRQQDVGKEDGGIDAQGPHRLKGHLGRQLRLGAYLQQGVLLRGWRGIRACSVPPGA